VTTTGRDDLARTISPRRAILRLTEFSRRFRGVVAVQSPVRIFVALVSLGGAATLPAFADTDAQDRLAAEGTVRSLHDALHNGDTAKVGKLLAPDAVILESGESETRAEYLSHHLPADIAFARAVPSTIASSKTIVDGDIAWVSSTSSSIGVYRGRSLNLAGAELVILKRYGREWRIRAIHWSSREAK
jgi:ketosteroid isomerase-like protein